MSGGPIVFENGEVVVRRRGIDRLRRGHLWIYRSDIVTTRDTEPGSIVRVQDERGVIAGKAFYSSRSQIALRLLVRGDAMIDEEFFRKRIAKADEFRNQIGVDPQLS